MDQNEDGFLYIYYLKIVIKYYHKTNLNNYFRLQVCLSFRTYVRLYICPYVTLSFFRIPAVVSQNVTNESCLACVKSEKYVVWVTLRPLGSIRQGEAELRTLQY